MAKAQLEIPKKGGFLAEEAWFGANGAWEANLSSWRLSGGAVGGEDVGK
jgi:hypothetical protein